MGIVGTEKNHLSGEKSPYLLQHVDNPVEWYPWGEEAFARAKKEDRPIFLSIGYSTCHWCHVMAHESFEDPDVAQLMNETFISIKVDREERPDIDSIYMDICQMLTGSGGWPLTIIMTPDKQPFFAGTYLPRESAMGRVGMIELIPRIQDVWENRRAEVISSAKEIVSHLNRSSDTQDRDQIESALLDRTYTSFRGAYDKEHGGFRGAPKFPSPHNLLFLLRYGTLRNNQEAINMVSHTLTRMRMGGIFDQIGFGFHRYSTDRHWLVPHFEKMLYDQAMLAMAYTEAYQVTGNRLFAETAEGIFTYVLRDLHSPEGGFYSAEDADSEGHEGAFYVWTRDQLKNILSEEEFKVAERVYTIKQEGNFLDEATQVRTGKNILHRTEDLTTIARDFNRSIESLEETLEVIVKKVFNQREKRIRPQRDDKVLTDWNGLMIAALALGGRVLQKDEYTQAAEKALVFIQKNLYHDGKLYHRYRDGEAGIDGFLDDYAFMIWGLTELYESTYNARYLKDAVTLNIELQKLFGNEKGSFFFTASDSEKLLTREIAIDDSALPSGNSVAIYNSIRLYNLTGDTTLRAIGENAINNASKIISQSPTAFTMFLIAAQLVLDKSYGVVISGESGHETTRAMTDALYRQYIPNSVVLFNPTDQTNSLIADLAPFVKNQPIQNNQATAYVCENTACLQPTNDPDKMIQLLKGR